LKKSSSKGSLKRQASSPYITLIDSNQAKISRSKSPKRKNKSVDLSKFQGSSMSTVRVRNKLGASFESLKKSTGNLFSKMGGRKDKENK